MTRADAGHHVGMVGPILGHVSQPYPCVEKLISYSTQSAIPMGLSRTYVKDHLHSYVIPLETFLSLAEAVT